MRPVSAAQPPTYLQPYARAVKRHGPDFRALLWASRRTQEQRFDALVKLVDPTGLTVLDVGCGRADLYDFLVTRGMKPKRYFGIEGVRELAESAENKRIGNARIIVADFVREPKRMQVNADIVFCSGALNTIGGDDFYVTIRNAFAAAKKALVFNFLSSSLLAGVNYLFWHSERQVMRFARTLTPDVEKVDGYIEGDCTIAMRKEAGE
jgi:SAM-dependent methyltransferase